MKITTNHQLRPEHMNHHLTLYGGQISFWLVEAAFVAAAKLWGSPDHLVMYGADNIRIVRSMRGGDILSLTAEVTALTTCSMTISVQGCDLLSQQPTCEGTFIFVTVDDNGKKMAHNLRL